MAMTRWNSRDRGVDYRRFAIQKALVEKHFVSVRCRLRHRHLKCEGVIVPSEDCAAYHVSIPYKQDNVPDVRITKPEIVPSQEIHMDANGTLCLYKSTDDPWKPSDNILENIIPWTAERLVFYELYLLEGKWLGPQAQHT
jgi:hypothetical protein